jgi:ubiquinone/menaquinone biosynthesis C-methylase UbiE
MDPTPSPSDSQTPATEGNRRRLREANLEHLLALEPVSYLDVGCGEGEQLRALWERTLFAVGIEPDEKVLRAAAEADGRETRILRADAHALPFADAAFDWVGVRHVLHHLARPRIAVSEAWRVARSGVVLSEPHFDVSDPRQRFGRRVDAWIRSHEETGDEVHNEELDSSALRALLPRNIGTVSVHHHRLDTTWPHAEIALAVHEVLGGRRPSEESARELDVLLEIARRDGIALAGSLQMIVWKPEETD